MIGKLPNFLIVGAAKSGTTSLYYYLLGHPEIYFPVNKEPSFFTADILDALNPRNRSQKPYINDFYEYQRLFRSVKNEKAIGEASTDTIYYYETSIQRIKRYLGLPKIIIILRNPPYAAFSMYTHMVRDNRETVTFEEALAMEDARINEGTICSYHYKKRALYSRQVEAFLEAFPEVRCYIYEEFIKDVSGTIKNICEFLEVDQSYQPEKPVVYNASGIPRYRWVNDLFLKYAPVRKVIREVGTSVLSGPVYARLRDSIRQKNMRKASMNSKTVQELKDYFREDILRLEKILNRDLSIWLNQ